jgi:ferredoxin
VPRLHVDWTRCDGHGLCAELLPELLDHDEWGFPLSRSGDRDPTIPARLVPHAEHAVRSCPLLALKILR